MAGRRSPQNSSISQLTSQPEPIPSCYRRSRHPSFQPLSGRQRGNRRAFIAAFGGALTWSAVTRAQPADRLRKIGLLWPATTPPAPPRLESLREGLREAGFVEGQNLVIELRYAQRGPQQLAEFAAEFVRLQVDVIQANGDLAPRVAQQATISIPIVLISDDVEGAGLIASLSRPGANTTGLTILSPELSAKRLEVLSEVVPGLSRVAALWDSTLGRSQATMTEVAAKRLKINLQIVEVRQYQWPAMAEEGAFLGYGPRLEQIFRDIMGRQLVKLLRGAKPTDIPVEQPTTFELAVNLKAAKALGLTIPESFLLRADQVIE